MTELHDERPERAGADTFLNLARVNQEQLWRRWGIEWKTNFMLWAALGVASGFVYREVEPLTCCTWWIMCVGYASITIYHLVFLLSYCIADEKDLDWLHYYKDQAELTCHRHPPDWKAHPRPDPRKRWEYLCERWAFQKCLVTVGMVVVTVTITIGALVLLRSKISCT